MSVPAPLDRPLPLPDFIARNDTVRMVLEWIADRFAEAPEVDTSIAWEDGEEHDEPGGPEAI